MNDAPLPPLFWCCVGALCSAVGIVGLSVLLSAVWVDKSARKVTHIATRLGDDYDEITSDPLVSWSSSTTAAY